ncbi:uncharacterized protein LOC113855799 [Abrus precatorius]|uniref:Uncharacterized protein LOC113855799 n=1 Tax=Abrus precatorius TaxID=3816 RepID=A0A8B8KHD9_ABRPR|nr:uncharacterized protein LOC113855799 [Abrus precatorius]
MRPAPLQPKTELITSNASTKINKNSRSIKKSSSSVNKPQQRKPVIIYARPPRIIHTHASDFKELVQKLTGLERSDIEDNCARAIGRYLPPMEGPQVEDNESCGSTSSVITEDLDSHNCVNSPSTPPIVEAPVISISLKNFSGLEVRLAFLE